ncbi:MAG TPA: chemotaxis-specific protein-glutamate methyltransferase CheB, partial [Bryobacteraceae bacterium]|nr:chemotaxis-specific protein-glutamate methyltransferase CheB [Bryobacteraceae bacterium]
MRIAIVNDLAIATEALRRALAGSAAHQVAWTAVNGAEALERCRRDRPDLILMDLVMPVMDGVEATRRIMRECPCAILVVTATLEGHHSLVFQALAAGALDAVQTPILAGQGQIEGTTRLMIKIDALSRSSSGKAGRETRPITAAPPEAATTRLIAMGASAGGPGAVAAILSALPADFPGAIVLVQHLDAEFVPALVAWLNEHSPLPVRMALKGDRPAGGSVLIAGTGDHLVLTDSGCFAYTAEPRGSFSRPSVDVFFQSVARCWRGAVAGVLLTGMGRDGSTGLKALRDSGALTIAQDSSTCVVYGMPRAAVELGAAAL